jgi:hypothetical protein
MSLRRIEVIGRDPRVGYTRRSRTARLHPELRSLAPSLSRYSVQIARNVSRCRSACACAGSIPCARSLSHSRACPRASSRVIAPTVPMVRGVGLGEPGYRVTRTKERWPLSVMRTAKPGTSASQTNLRLPFGAAGRARMPRSVSGFLGCISHIRRLDEGSLGQHGDNIMTAHHCDTVRPSATRKRLRLKSLFAIAAIACVGLQFPAVSEARYCR